MKTMIEEIRKRIKAQMDNTDAAGDYDEYADGQGVGLAAALRIIDEWEKEHPVPAYVQEAARAYSASASNGEHFRDLETGFLAGVAWRSELLMSGALRGNVAMCGVSAWVELQSNELTEYLRSNFKDEDEVRVIIIKAD